MLDDVRGNGKHCDREDGVNRKNQPFLFQSVKNQRDIEYQQKQREREERRCQIRQKHGRSGDAAVVKTGGLKKRGNPQRTDDACQHQKRKLIPF